MKGNALRSKHMDLFGGIARKSVHIEHSGLGRRVEDESERDPSLGPGCKEQM